VLAKNYKFTFNTPIKDDPVGILEHCLVLIEPERKPMKEFHSNLWPFTGLPLGRSNCIPWLFM